MSTATAATAAGSVSAGSPYRLAGPELVVSWIAQLAAAGILIQTLFFKFSGAEESVLLFSQLGVEPWGRIGSGVVELIASILLLVPRTAGIGGALAAAIMAGAIMSHVTVLGIAFNGDGGALFAMALVVFVSGLVVAWIRRARLPLIGERLVGK